ncbi:MAG: FAD-binding protein [Candidatus Electrothrix sp. AW5]|nr:FAD-binding protein [Candidatus Electrothrix gigas]
MEKLQLKDTKNIIKYDAAVIGGGLSGCVAALELARNGLKVGLFIKRNLKKDSNSFLLAGGLAAVDPHNNMDNHDKHIEDTLAAGKGLNDPYAVKFSIKNFYSEVIEWLIQEGVIFDLKDEGYSLHCEGGHCADRVFHHKDITGQAIMEKLIEKIINEEHVDIFEDHIAIDLIVSKDKVNGVNVYSTVENRVKVIQSRGVFLATGGLGKIFMYTSNSDVATGDGFAMCYRAGLNLCNMEFIQFHPTVFYTLSSENERERKFLLTEALRGAGAILKSSKDSSEDFVLEYDPLGSKSTRDVVTCAQDLEMRKKGLAHLWLDCTLINSEKLKKEFKNSYEFCLNKGFDITKEPIPVVYAAHYSNGGVLVDKNSETSVKGLYVLGESSYTGLHGATRLASNSGPECILYAKVAATDFISKGYPYGKVTKWDVGNAVEVKDKTLITYYWDIVRRTMTDLCGICRNKRRLEDGITVLENLRKQVNYFYWDYKITSDLLEVRNILDTSLAVMRSALFRCETRASHYRDDFKGTSNNFNGVTVSRKDRVWLEKNTDHRL